jgi:hypothetical protein
MDSIMAVLRRALVDEMAAQRAYAAIHTYTLGFAALEASRAVWQPAHGSQPASATRRRPIRDVEQAVSENPDLAYRLAAYTTPEQFRQGLDYLLDGIDLHMSRN